MRLWRNWYTRSVEVAVGFILWKFKSSQPHQINMNKEVKLKDNKAAKARIEEIDEILSGQGFITDFTVKNLGFL